MTNCFSYNSQNYQECVVLLLGLQDPTVGLQVPEAVHVVKSTP